MDKEIKKWVDEGILSIANNLETLKVVQKGIKGEKGDKGERGEKGDPGNIPQNIIDFFNGQWAPKIDENKFIISNEYDKLELTPYHLILNGREYGWEYILKAIKNYPLIEEASLIVRDGKYGFAFIPEESPYFNIIKSSGGHQYFDQENSVLNGWVANLVSELSTSKIKVVYFQKIGRDE